MTTPFKVKLTIYQGSTFRWHATFKNGSPAVVTDLTGYTARMQARGSIADANPPLLTLTTENGGITLGGVLGTIDLFLSATATAAITWTEAVYDLELIGPTPNFDVTRRIYGPIVVSPEVTR
jgi:hypothetical protein